MQNYQVNPIDPAFFTLCLVLLLAIINWLVPIAYHRQIFEARQRFWFKHLTEREQYFRDLRAGRCSERRRGDRWRSGYASDLEFEMFLVSLWRENEYWYPRRLAQFREYEANQNFIVHTNRASSPTGEKMDAIEYLVQ